MARAAALHEPLALGDVQARLAAAEYLAVRAERVEGSLDGVGDFCEGHPDHSCVILTRRSASLRH